MEYLRTLPYQKAPYSARNWGDSLHSLCSYPSKLKPGLAHFLVALFSEAGDVVLDPFSGCGTVPLEACLLGRQGIGSDLSPLARMLTAGKVSFPEERDLVACLAELDEALARPCRTGVRAPDEIQSFYHPRTMAEILVARDLVLEGVEIRDEARAGAWAMIGAAISHLLHGNRPYALSRRSHNIIPIPPRGPAEYKSLAERLSAKLNRMGAKSARMVKRGRVFQTAASSLPLEDETVDLIATSPPFLGTTDFLRQNRVRLWFAGWDYDRQREEKNRGKFLEFAQGLDPYQSIFGELHRVLRAGGLLVMHLGVVKGKDMAADLEPYGVKVGLAPQGCVYESVDHLESHGRVDRGATNTHAFLVFEKL